jgi:glycosyltransferase involved in cell wall biosynthesis
MKRDFGDVLQLRPFLERAAIPSRARMRRFGPDEFPGRPRILFVGLAESSHTHAWIDLLNGSRLNRRLFALPTAAPPADWPIPTYVTAPNTQPLETRIRLQPFPDTPVGRLARRGFARAFSHRSTELAETWLAAVIREWRPHIVHTLGLDPAAYLYLRARSRFDLGRLSTWVLQLRGGSDLTLARHDPDVVDGLRAVLGACDQLLSDNDRNWEYAQELGLDPAKIADIGPVPGTGGVDVARINAAAVDPPSRRHMIVFPKAYECPWSKSLPVLEALALAWDRIKPCEIHMLATDLETCQWFRTLPGDLRRATRVAGRVPRHQVLELMPRARVMLAPSLVDGTPSSLFEAMAAGALPIVSPLETITPIVAPERNVLFARNLYSEEIAHALIRAMTDDVLVDSAARRNLALVRELADRDRIRLRVTEYYGRLGP